MLCKVSCLKVGRIPQSETVFVSCINDLFNSKEKIFSSKEKYLALRRKYLALMSKYVALMSK